MMVAFLLHRYLHSQPSFSFSSEIRIRDSIIQSFSESYFGSHTALFLEPPHAKNTTTIS